MIQSVRVTCDYYLQEVSPQIYILQEEYSSHTSEYSGNRETSQARVQNSSNLGQPVVASGIPKGC
jgi:hypothetical protein